MKKKKKFFSRRPKMEFDNGLLKIEAEREREREVNRNSFISVNRVAFVDRVYIYNKICIIVLKIFEFALSRSHDRFQSQTN